MRSNILTFTSILVCLVFLAGCETTGTAFKTGLQTTVLEVVGFQKPKIMMTKLSKIESKGYRIFAKRIQDHSDTGASDLQYRNFTRCSGQNYTLVFYEIGQAYHAKDEAIRGRLCVDFVAKIIDKGPVQVDDGAVKAEGTTCFNPATNKLDLVYKNGSDIQIIPFQNA